ncbi:MAG: DNA-directed DNA polymerase [Thermoplasmata archaeon]|nr:DNA polymerase domain-containing protein [Thermoplasmata archaeon]
MDYKLRILSGSYDRTDEKNVVVELFGKTDDNKSIVVRYKNFRPYFYVVEPPEELIMNFKNDPEIINIEDKDLWVFGQTKKCKKIILHGPWKVPNYRKIAQEKCQVLAADIPFHHRFMYDLDLGSCINVSGKEIKNNRYFTDLVVEADSITNMEPFIPDLKILSLDIENSIKEKKILTIGVAIYEKGKFRTKNITYDDNAKIIKELEELIIKEDPDVITGYNIDGYDLPYILDLARELKLGFHIGRDGSEPMRIMGQFWRVHGRIVADAWWNVKRELKPKQETLNAVSKELLGEEKLDVDRSKMDDEWKNNKDKVIEYCINDAMLALKILLKIDVLRKYQDLSTVSKLPMDDVMNSGASTLIDSILIREADRNGIGVPLMMSQEEEEKIEGGYVHTIEPGLYHWVCVLDFKSMYPSIIIKYNICFTTINEKGTIVSPSGVKFLSKDVKEGLVPKILRTLMAQRDEIKNKMKKTQDENAKRYYNGLQQAIKILMNSFYGVFASSFYRFTNKEIGSSITAFARETVKSIIKDLEDKGIKVVYGDTDSVFFLSPKQNLEESIKFGNDIAEEISKKENLVFEFQQILEPFFSHGAKKRYVGKVVYPIEESGQIVVRGYETRRTDSFDLQSEVLMEIFQLILDGKLEEAKRRSKEVIDQVKKGNVPIEKLVISRSVRDIKEYKNPDSMPNVQAARKMQELGYEFIPGMKVSWIVVNDRKSPQEVEPFISGRPFTKRPDYDYYARRIAETLSRITEVFELDQNALMTGKRQTTLFENEKKKSKKGTLEDFL